MTQTWLNCTETIWLATTSKRNRDEERNNGPRPLSITITIRPIAYYAFLIMHFIPSYSSLAHGPRVTYDIDSIHCIFLDDNTMHITSTTNIRVTQHRNKRKSRAGKENGRWVKWMWPWLVLVYSFFLRHPTPSHRPWPSVFTRSPAHVNTKMTKPRVNRLSKQQLSNTCVW